MKEGKEEGKEKRREKKKEGKKEGETNILKRELDFLDQRACKQVIK